AGNAVNQVAGGGGAKVDALAAERIVQGYARAALARLRYPGVAIVVDHHAVEVFGAVEPRGGRPLIGAWLVAIQPGDAGPLVAIDDPQVVARGVGGHVGHAHVVEVAGVGVEAAAQRHARLGC
nr:hypothetical protein [Tanacetum cinerariifolium]